MPGFLLGFGGMSDILPSTLEADQLSCAFDVDQVGARLLAASFRGLAW